MKTIVKGIIGTIILLGLLILCVVIVADDLGIGIGFAILVTLIIIIICSLSVIATHWVINLIKWRI